MIDRPRAGQLRVIDDEGKLVGVMDVRSALELAEQRELDLVEIVPNADPPTCKLMDYGKFKYQQTRKTRGQKKSVIRRKEVKLRPKTEEHDFQVKIERARRFLDKGHKVLVSMIFRGRENVHDDLGIELLKRFAATLEEVAKVEKAPSREGRNKVSMILVGK